MPFFKRKDSNASEQTNGSNGNNGVDKVNFKARLDHKTFIVSLKWNDNKQFLNSFHNFETFQSHVVIHLFRHAMHGF